VKNLIVLLIVALTGVSCLGVVAAQELLIAPPGGDVGGMIPELAMPPMPEPVLDGDQEVVEGYAEPNSDEHYVTTPYSDSWETGESTEQLEPYIADEYQMYQEDIPVLESTGTWFRRGFWYTEVDAVIFNHKFNRDGVPIMFQPTGQTVGPFGPGVATNQLRVNGSKPGAQAAPRLTLGRFLFRDHKNRDHVGEFTIFGGGEWTQQARLDANPNNDLGTDFLLVPTAIDEGNTSFDNATSSQFRYDSWFNSFELNYHVKERMGRDHVEMEPSGRWVRRAGRSISRSFMAGVRYFELNEDFVWTASGITFPIMPNIPSADGSTDIHTENDMIGTQLGFSWFVENARWSGGVRAKGGMFVNLVDLRVITDVPTEDGLVSSDTALEADEISFIGEAALIGKWHLRPNFSLRAGLELLFLTSTAIAPAQSRGAFIPSGPVDVASNGDTTYLGGSIGFEGYW